VLRLADISFITQHPPRPHHQHKNPSIDFSLSCSTFSRSVVFHTDINEAGNHATKVNANFFHTRAKETLHLSDRKRKESKVPMSDRLVA
jgi:hypothetical protein